MSTSMVSIILPVYNVAAYLRESMDSVLRQTHENIEIILVDDGSTDESGSICREYADRDGRIRFFHQENSGVSEARNKGLDVAKGEYVLFIDPDDWVAEDIVEVLLAELKNGQTESALASFERIYFSDGVIDKRIPVQFPRKVKKTENYAFLPCWWSDEASYCVEEVLLCCGRLFNLEILKKNEIRFCRDLQPLEDTVLNLEYFSKTEKVATTDRILYFYRQRYDASTGLSAAKRDWVQNTEKGGDLIGRVIEHWPDLSIEQREKTRKQFHSFYADLVIYSFFRFFGECSFSKIQNDLRRVSVQELFLQALPDYIPKRDASILFPYFLKKKKPLLAYFALRFHFIKNKLLRYLKSRMRIAGGASG